MLNHCHPNGSSCYNFSTAVTLSIRTLDLIRDCAKDLAEGCDVMIVAHDRVRAVHLARVLCHTVKAAGIPCANILNPPPPVGAPRIRVRACHEAPLGRHESSNLRVHIDPSAVHERLLGVTPPRVRSVEG
jgi:hypothetical protein